VSAEVAGTLACLSARTPLQALVLNASRPRGQRWRLRLDRPLSVGQPLTLYATTRLEAEPPLPGEGDKGRRERWQVPLPAVLGVSRLEGEVILHLAGGDLVQVETVGLRE
jgi:hypothetical protein